MSSSYYNYCGSCSHLNLGDRNGGKFYCPVLGSYYPLDDEKCSRYDCDSNRTDYDIKVALGEAGGSSCYITTVCCELLRFKDNNDILETLRNFRNNILQKNTQYRNLLIEYDVLGPILANKIRNDKNKIDIVINIFYLYLSETVVYLKEKDYEKAIILYSNMINELIKHYNVNLDINYNIDYNMENGGHGYVKTRTYK